MNNSNKYRSSYSLYMRLHDQFSADVSDRRGVGTRITPFYAQKVDFGADRYDGF